MWLGPNGVVSNTAEGAAEQVRPIWDSAMLRVQLSQLAVGEALVTHDGHVFARISEIKVAPKHA